MDPKFKLGKTVMTQGIAALVTSGQLNPAPYLARHARSDWGNLTSSDHRLNDRAVADGSRILSSYDIISIPGVNKIWIITDAANDAGEREVTTMLLPSEY